MAINKKHLELRIATFIFKLIFMIFWHIIFAWVLSWRWLKYGSEELYFGKDFGGAHLAEIIEQNEKIIKHFEEKKS